MIEKANNGIITVKEAAEAIGLSTWQIKWLKQKVKEGGAAALVHRNSKRLPSNRISDETRVEIIRLKQDELYGDLTFQCMQDMRSAPLWPYFDPAK